MPALEQPSRDCDSRVVEVCIAVHLIWPLNVPPRHANAKSFTLTTARGGVRRDALRSHSKWSHRGKNYKLTRYVPHVRGACRRCLQQVRPTPGTAQRADRWTWRAGSRLRHAWNRRLVREAWFRTWMNSFFTLGVTQSELLVCGALGMGTGFGTS